MASMEELAYRWTSIKRFQVSNIYTPLTFKGIMGTLKNISAVPISIRVVDFQNDSYHHEWNALIAAEDSELVLMPGESIGPLFLDKLYMKAAHGMAHILVIRKELR